MPTLDELRRRFRKDTRLKPGGRSGTVSPKLKLELKTTGSDGKPLFTEEALLEMVRLEANFLAKLGIPPELVLPTLEHAKSDDPARIAEAIFDLADKAGIGLGPAAVATARIRTQLASPWLEELLQRVKSEMRNSVHRHRRSYAEVESAIGDFLNGARAAWTPRADTDPAWSRPHAEAVREATSALDADWLANEYVVKTFSTTATVELHGRGKIHIGTPTVVLATRDGVVPWMLVDRLFYRWQKKTGKRDGRTVFEHDVAMATVKELGRRAGLRLTTDRVLLNDFAIVPNRKNSSGYLYTRLVMRAEDANALIAMTSRHGGDDR